VVPPGVDGLLGDVWDTNIDAVSEREKKSALCVDNELLCKVGSKLSCDGGRVLQTSIRIRVDAIIGRLDTVPSRESDVRDTTLDGSVCSTDGTGKGVEKETKVPAEVEVGHDEVGIDDIGDHEKNVVKCYLDTDRGRAIVVPDVGCHWNRCLRMGLLFSRYLSKVSFHQASKI
jgi:hypothetical protein